MFSLEEAECIVEHAGVELISEFVAFTEEHQSQVLDLEDLAPFLGSLQACDIAIDLAQNSNQQEPVPRFCQSISFAS